METKCIETKSRCESLYAPTATKLKCGRDKQWCNQGYYRSEFAIYPARCN